VTADKIVDASALAALTFNEPDGRAVEARLQGALLYAPPLIDIEMASVCLKKIREALYPRDVLLQWYLNYPSIGVKTMEIVSTEAIELAEQMKLSFYDASYLWLARHLDLELVTLDDKLKKAARAI
jgi:predicted nucleic acid-binding protein